MEKDPEIMVKETRGRDGDDDDSTWYDICDEFVKTSFVSDAGYMQLCCGHSTDRIHDRQIHSIMQVVHIQFQDQHHLCHFTFVVVVIVGIWIPRIKYVIHLLIDFYFVIT